MRWVKMKRALIMTVGQQNENIKFCIKQIKPDYLVLLGTDTQKCKASIQELNEIFKFNWSNVKVYEVKDTPESIDEIIEKFKEGYDWLICQGVKKEDILVDPTGGRKWMSAGATMIASFLGLNMIYVDVKYTDDKEPDSSTMKITTIGNAYERTGLIYISVGDNLFNCGNFIAAARVYEFLEEKLTTSAMLVEVELKKKIALAYFYLKQFNFLNAFKYISEVIEKIERMRDIFVNNRDKITEKLKEQLEMLKVLKLNDEVDETGKRRMYFELLKIDKFVYNVLKFLYMLQTHYADNGYFDQAVIILYRILEFIAQYRLARHGIDTDNISDDIKQKYNETFRQITKDKDIYNAEKEIPDKIALLDSWILLYCIGDDILSDQGNINFLKAIKGKTKPRNLLWIEHKNESVDKTKYEDFKKFVTEWCKKIILDIENEAEKIKFISF